MNSDAYDDVIIGRYQDSSTYIFYGALSGSVELEAADVKILDSNAGDWAGMSVSGVGDMNADGYDDVLIGAPGSDIGGENAGTTYVFSGVNL